MRGGYARRGCAPSRPRPAALLRRPSKILEPARPYHLYFLRHRRQVLAPLREIFRLLLFFGLFHFHIHLARVHQLLVVGGLLRLGLGALRLDAGEVRLDGLENGDNAGRLFLLAAVDGGGGVGRGLVFGGGGGRFFVKFVQQGDGLGDGLEGRL